MRCAVNFLLSARKSHAGEDCAKSSATTRLQSTAESLRAEIRQGDEETRRYMRVLHEDVIARIAALGDARR